MSSRKPSNLGEKRQRVQQVVAARALGAQVRDVMTPKPLTVDRATPIGEVFTLFDQHRIEHLLVVDEGELVGILRDRDVVRVFSTDECDARAFRQLLAGDLMGLRPAHVAPDADLALAARMMVENGIHCLPVTEAGHPIGIVTTTDLLLALEAVLTSAGGGTNSD